MLQLAVVSKTEPRRQQQKSILHWARQVCLCSARCINMLYSAAWYLPPCSAFPLVNIRSAASHLSVGQLKISLSAGWSRDPGSCVNPLPAHRGHSALMPPPFPTKHFLHLLPRPPHPPPHPFNDIGPAFNFVHQNDNRHQRKLIL